MGRRDERGGGVGGGGVGGWGFTGSMETRALRPLPHAIATKDTLNDLSHVVIV